MKDIIRFLAECQQQAPSYIELLWDEAPLRCENCGQNSDSTQIMVKVFTPDGKSHKASHKECIDPEWLARAKNMGRL